MKRMLDMIYCADGNKGYADIAISAGFTYGSQPTKTFYHPIDFADIDPDDPPAQAVYIAALKQHTPRLATTRDWEKPEQLAEVLAWAEDAAPYVERLIIIPKFSGGIGYLPRKIGGKPVVLGYSVPTSHGGTTAMAWEFVGWPVHLLGGSPHKQYHLATRWLDNVVSADGNMALKMANRYCAFFVADGRQYRRGHWPSLKDANGQRLAGDDANYEAFARSCDNILAMWSQSFEVRRQ